MIVIGLQTMFIKKDFLWKWKFEIQRIIDRGYRHWNTGAYLRERSVTFSSSKPQVHTTEKIRNSSLYQYRSKANKHNKTYFITLYLKIHLIFYAKHNREKSTWMFPNQSVRYRNDRINSLKNLRIQNCLIALKINYRI